MGFGTPELGYVSRSEIEAIRVDVGGLGTIPLERDLQFRGAYPLSAYTSAAREAGKIITSNSRVMVMSNIDDVDDMTFDSDVGSWNVTRAQHDCAAGKHKIHTFEVEEARANNAKVTVDEDKISAMVADPTQLVGAPPLIFATEQGRIWLIDGHHRLRAMARLGHRQFRAFVIEEADAAPYRILFNGERVAPWLRNE
jgi:hypothetical protein